MVSKKKSSKPIETLNLILKIRKHYTNFVWLLYFLSSTDMEEVNHNFKILSVSINL